MRIFPTRLRTRFLFLVIGLIMISLTAAAIYFYWQYQQLRTQNPENEIKQITKKLSMFMELPSDAVPTLATVTEKEKLSDQEFFKKALNGDKVLIYLDEGKAILFRPSTGKVIDVAPVRRTDPITNQEGLSGQEEPVNKPEVQRISVSVYNGSGESGIAVKTLNMLQVLSFPYTEGVTRDASRQTYTQTMVIDLAGSHAEQAREVARLVDGVVGQLPQDEVAPAEGGILVIVGKAPTEPQTSATPSPTATPVE